ncbi:cache domain-containing sensor histidine kinase [Paenibacillus endoradicis]|uniref:cache domain-containing sensor histidine kinase n=1 Tax=Paenibacillus endoradicis TaxID=2972487 RepID=UPI0021595C35|nr:sensor histidine kinase [Paenibacillus endoradicis]MCR8657208.1 sensor histidine kinase [Paenibacillus endoradicis]
MSQSKIKINRPYPMRWKLFLWIAPFFLVTIAITGGFSYYIASKLVLNNVGQAQYNLAKTSLDQFDYIAQDAIDFSNYLFLSMHTQQLLATENDPVVRKDLFSSLSTLMVTRHSMQSVILYTLDPNNHQQPFAINHAGIASAIPFERFASSSLYQQTLKADGKPVWALMRAHETVFDGDRQTKIVLSKVVKDSSTLDPKGIVLLGFNESKLREQYMKTVGKDNQIYVIDQNGLILSASNQEWQHKNATELPFIDGYEALLHNEKLTHIDNKQWIVSHSSSNLTGWHVLVVQEKQQLLTELKQIQTITILIMVACFVVSLIITWIASSLITNPLKKLLRSMRRLQNGDFSQRVDFSGQDEIGRLGEGYNNMVIRIKDLIDEVYAMQLKQRNAELKTLQAQIHPHFLYNTLDMICWTAQQRGQKDISELVYSLSNLFRLSLSEGRDFITLEEELELIRSYLYLQKQRFKDRLHFEIHVPDEALALHVPKLLLQPLIENAVIHGIEPLHEHGFIQVTIQYSAQQLSIEVMDNGVGIQQERLHQINQALRQHSNLHRDQQSSAYFALTNVKERLIIIYGSDILFHITSTEGKGTLVSMTFPISEGGIQYG